MVFGIVLIALGIIMTGVTIVLGVRTEDDIDAMCTSFSGMLAAFLIVAGSIVCCEESEPKEGTIVCRYYDVKSQQTITISEDGDTVISWLHYIDYKN